MVGNASMTNFEKISKIIKSNGGYVTGRDVSEANIPTSILSQYIKKYNLKKHLYFCEKQVDSFHLWCYTPVNLKT